MSGLCEIHLKPLGAPFLDLASGILEAETPSVPPLSQSPGHWSFVKTKSALLASNNLGGMGTVGTKIILEEMSSSDWSESVYALSGAPLH